MNKDTIIKEIGYTIYFRESEVAYRLALNTGGSDVQLLYDSDIPYKINRMIWGNNDLSTEQKLHLLFDVYNDIPCYPLLSAVYMHHYRSFSQSLKNLFFENITILVSQENDVLAEPVVYMLDFDFFEDTNLSSEAWIAVTANPNNINLAKRILPISGPVPFHLKEIVYHILLENKAFHEYIFQSLWASCFLRFGDIDKTKALLILKQLEISRDTQKYQELYTALTTTNTPI